MIICPLILSKKLEAGVSEEKSSEAAKAIANYDNRFVKIESDLLILKWMVGLVIVVEILPILKSIFWD